MPSDPTRIQVALANRASLVTLVAVPHWTRPRGRPIDPGQRSGFGQSRLTPRAPGEHLGVEQQRLPPFKPASVLVGERP